MKYQDRIKLMNEIQNELEAATKTASDSNPVENGTDENGTDTNMENGTVQSGTEEHFDITTKEGYVNQLNKLYSKGSIDKEYYIEQVRILKNNYPNSYELIKNKLLMN